MKKIRVLMVEPFGRSGICYYTNSLCHSLRKYTDCLLLITAKDYELKASKRPFLVFAVLGGMKIGASKIVRSFNSLVNPWIILRNRICYKANIVHFQSTFIPFCDLVSMALVKLLRSKIVFTVHEVKFSTSKELNFVYDKMVEFVLSLMYKLSDKLIIHTDNAQEELTVDFKIKREKIYRLPHGVMDSHNFDGSLKIEQARQKINIGNERICGLFFGSLRKSKGLDLVIQALPLVIERVPRFILFVAGNRHSSENPRRFIERASELGLVDKNIKFDIRYIPHDDVPAYFVASDFVVLPYRDLYQSGVLSTAYYFGRPVVASKRGNLADDVIEGVTGYFVDDPEDADELAQKIVAMSINSEARCNMGRNARNYAKQNLSWDDIAVKLSGIYADLL